MVGIWVWDVCFIKSLARHSKKVCLWYLWGTNYWTTAFFVIASPMHAKSVGFDRIGIARGSSCRDLALLRAFISAGSLSQGLSLSKIALDCAFRLVLWAWHSSIIYCLVSDMRGICGACSCAVTLILGLIGATKLRDGTRDAVFLAWRPIAKNRHLSWSLAYPQ